jgi:hypothetical protein
LGTETDSLMTGKAVAGTGGNVYPSWTTRPSSGLELSSELAKCVRLCNAQLLGVDECCFLPQAWHAVCWVSASA